MQISNFQKPQNLSFQANLNSNKLKFKSADFWVNIRGYGKNGIWAHSVKNTADTAVNLIRKDTSAYNKDRKIQYALYDTEKKEYTIETLPETVAKKSEDVFNVDSFARKKVTRPTVDYSQIGQLLERFTKQDQGKISLDEVLKRIGTPAQNRMYIKEVHEVAGLKYT